MYLPTNMQLLKVFNYKQATTKGLTYKQATTKCLTYKQATTKGTYLKTSNY